MSYVYIKSEVDLYTVGFYTPTGEWEPESDWGTTEEAADRVNWLNGGNSRKEIRELKQYIVDLLIKVEPSAAKRKLMLSLSSRIEP
jgi:hypothetical protein